MKQIQPGPEDFPCTKECWTQQRCPTCGSRVPPRGRSVPLSVTVPNCCGVLQHSDWNRCHQWDEESAREEWEHLCKIRKTDEGKKK